MPVLSAPTWPAIARAGGSPESGLGGRLLFLIVQADGLEQTVLVARPHFSRQQSLNPSILQDQIALSRQDADKAELQLRRGGQSLVNIGPSCGVASGRTGYIRG